MAESPSPGRARRMWLEGRLRWARRAVDLLDRKRQVLLSEDRRLAQERDEAAREWTDSVRLARVWSVRAAAVAGEESLQLAVASLVGRADLVAERETVLGVDRPVRPQLVLPRPSDALLAATGSAVAASLEAHRRAVEAAARYAVARTGYLAVHAELTATERRQRAIERIRVPAMEAELRALTLRLDEIEREERVLSRWASGRGRPA